MALRVYDSPHRPASACRFRPFICRIRQPENMQERATVPVSFLRDMLTGARRQLRAQDIDAIATQAGISPLLLRQGAARVTREQFVRMYEGVALFMGDEMLGLWSRPIRAGALKYLGLSLLDAPSLMVAMYRFTRFWNLLLDDYRLRMARANGVATVTIAPRLDGTTPTPFGHELMVKLIHGVASWLVGRQLGIAPETVEDVVITHLHYDHAGNLDLFPKARFHLQEAEMGFATGRHMCQACIRYPFDVEDVVRMVRAVYAERGVFNDDDAEIDEGLTLHKVGGHGAG
eukprot:gene621-863_t